MTNAMRFLQIHTLASYPATLLNRDDSGLAKRLPFGDATRTRISSQCLKRHWRITDDVWALKSLPDLHELDFGVRSRQIFQSAIADPLVEAGLDRGAVEPVVVALQEALKFKTSKKSSKDDDGEGDDDNANSGSSGGPDTDQAFMLGRAEIEYLKQIVRSVVEGNTELEKQLREKPKDKKKLTSWQKATKKLLDGKLNLLKDNLATMGISASLPRGLESALFGRMVTSDLIANTDAAIHVAHAFTVHPEASESDYFTVVDDLKAEASESGAGGLFDTELTAGLFYGYVVVDIPGLVANLADDRALAGKVVEHLVHLIATVSPGAKKGSTAPYAFADLMLIEAGRRQPRTLANAFRKPCKASVGDACDRLADYVGKVDRAYGGSEARRHLAVEPVELPRSELLDIDALAAWARDQAAATKAG